MTFLYTIIAIALIHTLFLLFPVYRDEALDVYSWTPWKEKEYVLFKKAIGNNKAIKVVAGAVALFKVIKQPRIKSRDIDK